MAISVYEYPVVVQHSDIDENLHANNVSYIKWMQEAAIAHSTANGWPNSRYFQEGFAWVARRHTIDYLQSAKENENIMVETWVATWKHVSSVRKYRFIRVSDNVTVATAETNWAFVNVNTGKPVKIPENVSNSFVIASR